MNIFKRVIGKTIRETKHIWRKGEARRLGVLYEKPVYIYRDVFSDKSVIVDVGCANDADFSKHMMGKYGLRAYGVDPTRKHRGELKQLEEKTNGQFKHLQYAVTAKDGKLTFHESAENQSGSILDDHSNVMRDTIKTYDVESISLSTLMKYIEAPQVDLLKLDLEGAEYELLRNVSKEDLGPFRQLFIEFHHHNTSYTTADTQKLVDEICSLGYTAFSFDDHNYLFFK